jgi:hypothetical protein
VGGVRFRLIEMRPKESLIVIRRRATPIPHSLALLAAVTLALAGCGGSEAAPEDPEPLLPLAPWSAPALDSASIAAPYLEAWRTAENRASCALLAFTESAPGRAGAEATARTARFGGGWGVAWDLPELRSAWGVAGTGTEPGPNTYDDWPYRREWRDGSSAGYGPEGGTGPKQLAYLEVTGQGCLYNVWSRLGRDHLEGLLEGLRYVDGAR